MIQPSTYPYTFNRFLQHLRESVLYYPDSDTLRLSSFAYINALDDLNKQNLGFTEWDAGKEYCLSKRYEKKKTSLFEFDFPVLAIAEGGMQAHGIFKTERRSQKITHNCRIWVLDLANRNKEYSNNLLDRHISQVYSDTRTILLDVLTYIAAVRLYKVTNLDASISYGWYHPGVIAELLSDAKISAYVGEDTLNDLAKANSWVNEMFSKTEVVPMGFEPPFTERVLAGTYVDLSFQAPVCRNITFDFEYTSNDFVYGPSH